LNSQVHHAECCVEKWDLWGFWTSLPDPWCSNVALIKSEWCSELLRCCCCCWSSPCWNLSKFRIESLGILFDDIGAESSQFIVKKDLQFSIVAWKMQISSNCFWPKLDLIAAVANFWFLQDLFLYISCWFYHKLQSIWEERNSRENVPR
jgi:hypothetical protein